MRTKADKIFSHEIILPEGTDSVEEIIINMPKGYNYCQNLEFHDVDETDEKLYRKFLVRLQEERNGQDIVDYIPNRKLDPVAMGVNYVPVQFPIRETMTVKIRPLSPVPVGEKIHIVLFFELMK